MNLGDGELNLPYEEIPDGPVNVEADMLICGGLAVRAGMVPDPRTDAAYLPVLLLDFHLVTGERLPTIGFIVTVEEMLGTANLVAKAARSAVRHAQRGPG